MNINNMTPEQLRDLANKKEAEQDKPEATGTLNQRLYIVAWDLDVIVRNYIHQYGWLLTENDVNELIQTIEKHAKEMYIDKGDKAEKYDGEWYAYGDNGDIEAYADLEPFIKISPK